KILPGIAAASGGAADRQLDVWHRAATWDATAREPDRTILLRAETSCVTIRRASPRGDRLEGDLICRHLMTWRSTRAFASATARSADRQWTTLSKHSRKLWRQRT